MKSFFKKLAFVMALAMVVSMAAPAAKVAVAADKALAVTYQNENHYSINEVNLANVGDKEDLKFLWAPSNWKELGVKWTSSNENVVTVDSNGVVTAVAAGTADVSVAVGTETATVAVNVEELPAYTVSIGLGDERSVTEKELEVGESVDFAFYGIKDYSRDKVGALPRYLCTWQSDDTTVLSKDNEAGLFTAVKAGTAKVTLTVANVLTGQTHNVIPVAVTVKAPVVESNDVVIVTGRNKTQNTVEVELPKAATLGLADIEIFRVYFADNDENGDGVIDERDIDKPYESVYVNKFNGSAKNYVAETFDDFIDGVIYEVQVKGFEPVRFTASVGDVATVVVNEKTGASLATEDLDLVPATVEVKLYDAKGVDVTTRKIDGVANNDASNVTFWLTDETAAEYAMTDYNVISFYEMATADVRATYDNNGVVKDSVDPCLITPDPVNEYSIKRVVSWSLVDPAKNKVEDWTKPVHEVPAGEYGYVIATLLEDSRGNYFTTHEPSTATKYAGKAVSYTEDENQAFWIYGYRVEYRAMDPDKMLVEDYGNVASYEEGRARFALYLYNQFETAEEEFIKELYSQYVIVCHPKKLTDMKADSSVKILMNTEYDEETEKQLDADVALDAVKSTGVTTAASNAYYGLFSVKTLNVSLVDIHGGDATTELDEANFELQLVTNTEDATLKDIIADYQNELNSQNGAKRTIKVEANDFIDYTKNQVKFTIKETVTGVKRTVTITLVRPATETDELGGKSAKVATIDEYSDTLEQKLTFEKFIASVNGITVEQRIKDARTNTNGSYKDATINGYDVFLKQTDKSGNEIGIDNNLFVATTLDPKTTFDVIDGETLDPGDRIITVKGPDGKVYTVFDGQNAYKNPAFTSKVPATYRADEDTTLLGVKVVTDNAYTYSASSAAANAEPVKDVAANKYNFVFRALGTDNEIIYAKSGRYTVTIKTVKAVATTANADGSHNIEYTKSTGLADSFTITVANNNATVKYAGRDLTRVEGSISDYEWAGTLNNVEGTVNAEYGDKDEVKELILKAFDFNLNNSLWKDDYEGGSLTAEDILYYTYTLTPTNKQVVINKVVFKVPVDAADQNSREYGWYRSEATVNKSLTFDYE